MRLPKMSQPAMAARMLSWAETPSEEDRQEIVNTLKGNLKTLVEKSPGDADNWRFYRGVLGILEARGVRRKTRRDLKFRRVQP